jgi:hypothetical protein
MNSEMGEPKLPFDAAVTDDDDTFIDDDELEEETDVLEGTTIVLSDTGALTDNVGDVSVEINVEELIAELEACEDKDAARKKEIRRRLEDMAEERSFEDTYAIDFEDKTK